MSKISLYVSGLGLGFEGVVGGLYVHTLVKNLLIKFLMMLCLVANGCKFDSCQSHPEFNLFEFFEFTRLLHHWPSTSFLHLFYWLLLPNWFGTTKISFVHIYMRTYIHAYIHTCIHTLINTYVLT